MFRKFLVVFLCLLLVCQPVMASWLSFASAGLTLVGAISAAIFPVGGAVAGGICCMVECVGYAIDVIQTIRLPAWQWSEAPPPYYDDSGIDWVYDAGIWTPWPLGPGEPEQGIAEEIDELLYAEFEEWDLPDENIGRTI